MNIHKIILAVLAAVTIAVGTTTVTVYADGPGRTPEAMLIGADAAAYRGLPQSVKTSLTNEFLPQLELLGFDGQSTREFLALVVRAEKSIHDRVRMSSVGNLPSASSRMSVLLQPQVAPGGRCYMNGPVMYHNGLVVAAYTSVYCTVIQQSILATTELVKVGGRLQIGSTNTRVGNRAFSMMSLPYARGTYNACSRFTTSPRLGYGFAQPTGANVCIDGYRVR